MSKKFFLPVLVLMTGLVVISCDGFVSKVQVKGSPTFHAPLGSKSFSVSNVVSIKDIKKMIGGDGGSNATTVYEYPFGKESVENPGAVFVPGVEDSTIRFLVHYPLTSMVFSLPDGSLDLIEGDPVVVELNETIEGDFPEGISSLNFSALKDDLPEGLTFADIPMYLYISGGDFTGTAKIVANYNTTTSKELLSDGTAVTNVSDLNITDTEGLITKALSKPSASLENFSTVVNAGPSDLVINYKIDIETITFKVEDITSGITLKLDLVIVFPFAFKAEGNPKMELMSAGDSDLLQREVGSEDKIFDDIFNNLKSMEMILDIDNNLGLEGSLILSALSSVPGGEPFIKEISMGAPGFKESKLSLTKEDIDFIKTNNPFTPSFSLEIPNGEHYIQRSGGIEVKITLSVETDIDYSFDLQGDK